MNHIEYKLLAINKALKKNKEFNFYKIDDRYFYVYRISNFKLNKHYYGSRVSKINPKEDLGFKYLSSSTDKDFIQDQIDNPQYYKYKVVRIFDNNQDKIMYESYLHNKFNVVKSKNFYNKCKQTPFGRDTAGISPTNIYTYRIYDNNDLLIYKFKGSFNQFCKEHKLPRIQLEESYNNKGKPIYLSKYSHYYHKVKNHLMWYCLINDDIQEPYNINKEVIELEGLIERKKTNKLKRQSKIGSNHNNFKKRYIYIPKLNKNIIFDKNSGFNNFSDFLKANNLPICLLSSATNKGKPIYCDLRSETIAIKKGYEEYIGSYVLYENEEQDILYKDIEEYKRLNKEKHIKSSILGAEAIKRKYSRN